MKSKVNAHSSYASFYSSLASSCLTRCHCLLSFLLLGLLANSLRKLPPQKLLPPSVCCLLQPFLALLLRQVSAFSTFQPSRGTARLAARRLAYRPQPHSSLTPPTPSLFASRPCSVPQRRQKLKAASLVYWCLSLLLQCAKCLTHCFVPRGHSIYRNLLTQCPASLSGVKAASPTILPGKSATQLPTVEGNIPHPAAATASAKAARIVLDPRLTILRDADLGSRKTTTNPEHFPRKKPLPCSFLMYLLSTRTICPGSTTHCSSQHRPRIQNKNLPLTQNTTPPDKTPPRFFSRFFTLPANLKLSLSLMHRRRHFNSR